MQDTTNQTVLIVDDDLDLLDKVRLMLLTSGIQRVVKTSSGEEVLPLLADEPASVVVLDWVMPGLSGADLLQQVLRTYPDLPVIILTALNDVQTAVECMRLGAFDFITKPVEPNRLLSSIHKAFQINELHRQNRSLKESLLEDLPARAEMFGDVIVHSRKMKAIFRYIESLATSRNPVLITGESGVGKEVIARAIHRTSGLTGSFVALNVAGLDDHMFSDTLFGHKRGAFTGASEGREGLLKKAENGTIFLDEIGDLSMEMQLKLLRLVQEKEYYRLGSDALIKTNARVIAATNRNFRKMIDDGRFRHDLYHRLSSHEFTIPPLRERIDDVLPLMHHFIARAASAQNKPIPEISPQVLELLPHYPFTGNVRELENKCCNAVAMNMTGTLTLADFPGVTVKTVTSRSRIAPQAENEHPSAFRIQFDRFPTLHAVERYMIDEALKRSDGNRSNAADLLGIARMTLIRKLNER
jgi:DNA-binding NtrC family response regulator